ncbi:MAG: ORF6N domain-containing protein [Candidatus Moraniibacteriota bacterium]
MSEAKNKKSIVIIPDERIIGKIYYIRGEKVIFDKDLALLYGVETKVLNQAVKRNIKRFPEDFMFQLNKKEADIFSGFQFGTSSDENSRSQIVTSRNDKFSRSQIVTLNRGQNIKYLPYVFTEPGIAMLSSVLKSDRAIQVNIQIMRAFIGMRKILSTHKELRDKIEKMEKKNESNFKIIFKIINRLMMTDPKDKELKVIGFREAKK